MCGCKKTKAVSNIPSPNPSTLNQAVVLSRTVNSSQSVMAEYTDDEFVLCRYTSGNMGKHGVNGMATKIRYGYRKGGDEFLVHRDDISNRPDLFSPVYRPEIPEVEAYEETPTLPPPPAPIRVDEEPVVWHSEENDADKDAVGLDASQNAALAQARFSLDELDGMNKLIRKSMIDAGMTTPQRIVEAGWRGLFELKHIGEVKAKRFYAYVVEHYT